MYELTMAKQFDCTWTGPELTCDANGKVTNKDMSDKRKTQPRLDTELPNG